MKSWFANLFFREERENIYKDMKTKYLWKVYFIPFEYVYAIIAFLNS